MLAGDPLSIPGLTLLCPDAVVVALRVEQLTPGKVVAVHIARDAREPLHAVSGGPGTQSVDFVVSRKKRMLSKPPLCRAGDLPGEDVELLGGGQPVAAVGVGQGHRVRRGRPELHIH